MRPGDVLSYHEMCAIEGKSLQHGMHFRIGPAHCVLLMSTQPGAPHADEVRDGGAVLIYEGHDEARTGGGPDPKTVDQPLLTSSGSCTQNGRLYYAAEWYRNGELPAERVRVYEKVRSGIWVYNGVFRLVDAWQEESNGRQVVKLRLEITDEEIADDGAIGDLEHTRMIPSSVKREVWQRDGGRCRRCGATDHLHFDHIIPFSRGGTSVLAENVQLLCARRNLEKRNRIE